MITKAGTVIDSMDIHGYIAVRAPNVTIKNSIVRGRSTSTTANPLISNYGGSANHDLLIEDTLLQESTPNPYNTAGIAGSNFTALRVHVAGQVDSIDVLGDNVTITDSLLEDTVFYAHHFSQGGGSSHSDNIQIMNGNNVKVEGNTIRGSENFAITGAAEHGPMNNLLVADNYVDGGLCTMKYSTFNGYSNSATVRDNRFGPNRTSTNCTLVVVQNTNIQLSDNTYASDGQAVPILRTTS